ncbi:protein mom-5 [Octopus sinensis]|uniref:Protein mom-5 n=1 Tax=Octopus sinensis TaxID=2607531 RepID=A0A6P7T1U3_9MOLL|nr:protein mom-5 [Octopus sinensis]
MLTKNYLIYLLFATLLIMAVIQPGNAKKKRKKSRKRKRPTQVESYNTTTCAEIMLPMCRNLIPYTHTQLTMKKEGVLMTQGQLSALVEPLWAYMDTECSPHFRELACGYYLPKCHPTTGKPMLPCRSLCRDAKKECSRTFSRHRIDWPSELKCTNFPTKNCMTSSDDSHVTSVVDTGTRCIHNVLPMCANLTSNHTAVKKYMFGVLPNMFLQNSPGRIFIEMNNFEALVKSQCSPNLAFFVCGVYLPFCTGNEGTDGFRVPCKELCEEVFSACKAKLYEITGVNWPSKFQCHRYPSRESTSNRLKCLEAEQLDIIRQAALPSLNKTEN